MGASATESLISCLLQMAETETNPVLEVIDLETPLKENKKYPAGLLSFNQTGWRAYYHCHPASRAGNHRFKGEHGHFHIFVRTQAEPDVWAHVVALAMDNMGQPIGWFTVNHWVTGEEWQSESILSACLKHSDYEQQESLVEKWLLSILAVSHKQIRALLIERDRIIANKCIGSSLDETLMNKEIYLLSEKKIDLKQLLGIKL